MGAAVLTAFAILTDGLVYAAYLFVVAIGKGHQGISDISYGTNRFNKAEGRPEIVDVVRYPAECVNPPADVDSQVWLEGGMKGAKCN